MNTKQLDYLKKQPNAYGGALLKTRQGRSRPRPLATHHTMHLVLRSSKAKGDWSLRRGVHQRAIKRIMENFSRRYAVKIIQLANVGNHLHLHIKLGRRETYPAFIRAVTGAIVIAVTGSGRGRPLKGKFWDRRPFTRIVKGYRAFLRLRDYVMINQLEASGHSRSEARYRLEWDRRQNWKFNTS